MLLIKIEVLDNKILLILKFKQYKNTNVANFECCGWENWVGSNGNVAAITNLKTDAIQIIFFVFLFLSI